MQLLVAEALGLGLQHALLGGPHAVLGQGGGDLQAAAVDLVVGVAEPVELLAHQREHVAALTAVGRLRLDLGELRQVLEGLVALVGGDGSQGRHRVQDVGVAPLERLAGVLAVGGVEAGGVVDDAGQDRSLAQVQALGRLVEEGPGGGLHAVRAATEVDGVEVVGQQLGLGDLALELQGQDGLLELALVGLLLAEVEDLDVLLGDRGGTLAVTARGVVEHRAQDALDVDAGVGPEGLVLGGDHRVLDRVGHLVVGDDRTVLRGERAELGLAVGVVDARGLGLEVLVGARDVDGAVEVEERRTRDEGQHEPRDRGPLQGPQAALLPGAGLLGPGCRALPHRRAGSPALACHVSVAPLLLGGRDLVVAAPRRVDRH